MLVHRGLATGHPPMQNLYEFLMCAAALIPALVQGKFKRWIGYLIGGLYIAYLIIMFTCFGA